MDASLRLGLSGAMLLLLCLSLPSPASAQLFSYEEEAPRPTQSLSFAYHLIDFTYTGGADSIATFDYVDPGYGLVYTRPNLFVSIALGNTRNAASENVQLLDASFFTWGEFRLSRGRGSRQRHFFIPIALHSHYRRVSHNEDVLAEASADAFGVTVLGLGTGLGFSGQLGKRVQLEARATPVIGLAARSFGDATGSARIFDADATLHFGPFVGRLGLSAGYGFRVQVWNINASSLFPDAARDFYDYRGQQHTFRVGINW